ncbi:Non-specific serine/threonine protein kinase [Bertholletia excelsa]
MENHRRTPFLLSFFYIILSLQSTFAVEFLFNGFDPSNVSLYGNATIESRVLTLTNLTSFSIGRAMYPSRIPTKDSSLSPTLPFSTSFIFSMSPFKGFPIGHGMVFFFASSPGIDLHRVRPAQYFGLLNYTNNGDPNNHVFGIEFDVFNDPAFDDISDNHVGIDVNSLKSTMSQEAGYYTDEKFFKKLKLNSGKNYQVWIDYANHLVTVTLAPVGLKRPTRPLLSCPLDLSRVLKEEMYVGFTASTGKLLQSNRILAWSFSNSNFSLSEALVTAGLPSFEPPKVYFFESRGFIVGSIVGVVSVLVTFLITYLAVMKRKRRMARAREEMEEWELQYWPHRISFQEIEAATKGFSEENVIGIGGNGKVYKGVLAGGEEVAVKRILHEKGSLILVYDYMENGSLDRRIFDCEDSKMLSCGDRIRVLTDVALGIFYLHEGWEAKVIHRDIKASNILLDKEMNGRLGDFGLARVYGPREVASTTKVVGTVGYLAPEVIKSGRVSTQTDVFGFGILVLEVMCGRRPIEEGKPHLVRWVWELMEQGKIVYALDERLRATGGFDEEQVEIILQLGLLCAHRDAHARPTMRHVLTVLEGKKETVDERESEDMGIHLLEKMKRRETWCNKSAGSGSYLTFEQFRLCFPYSISSAYCTNSTMEAR